MTAPLLWGAYDYWPLYHKITFDGIQKRIYINPDVTSIDVEADLYSSWKEWSQVYDNLKYLPAFRTTGGDPLPGGRRVGQYFFLINGWKIIPPIDYLRDDIELVGNLFSDDGSDVFDLSGFDNFRLVRQVVSQFTEIAAPEIDVSDLQITITGSGLTPEESQKLDSLVTVNNAQTQSLQIISESQQLTNITLDTHTSLLLQQSASLYQQLQELTIQSASLAEINIKTNTLLTNTASGSLTPTQATMLLEMYNLLGLDPTIPLIVTPTSRDAGDISQTIDKTGDTVIVTRV